MSTSSIVDDNNSLEPTSPTGLAAFISAGHIAMLKAYTKANHQYANPVEVIRSENVAHDSPWEIILRDSQENSGVSYCFPENSKDEILSQFANSLIEDMHAAPKEFDKIFEENFWDILA